MSEKGIYMHKYEDGNEAIVVEFGFGKIGIGLEKPLQQVPTLLQFMKREKKNGRNWNIAV